MMNLEFSMLNFFVFFAGAVLGAIGFWISFRLKIGKFDGLISSILLKAEADALHIRQAAEIESKQSVLNQQKEIELSWQNEKKKIQKEEDRLKMREDKVEARMNAIEKKLGEVEKTESLLKLKNESFVLKEKDLQERCDFLISELEKCSGLSSGEAKELLLSKLTNDVKTEAAYLMRKIKKEAEEESEKEANTIIATAINRMASHCVSEITVNTVPIPNEEIKGRIIGREGRNIRTLERLAGVNFIIDDTPGLVVLSGFDPIRMHVAKTALSELVADGRIHPTRIEEAIEKAKANVQRQIKMFGEDAALRAGAMNLHPELIALIGKLKFRFSYGQNVLEHSLEVSYLLGIMAAELGLDQAFAKRIGLLHDIGKAVSHEVEGSHAIIGHDLALKYGESKWVANGIGSHHQEMDPLTIEARLCIAADALSASRPGARSGAIGEYVKRLKQLEEMAAEFEGVDRAFVMQSGREVIVIVVPEVIDDDGVVSLARDITKKIECELSYPGKIKVSVIREKRVVEYAL